MIESPDIIGVWEHDQVLFVAGHNLFEQAPALGQAVARAACGKGLADHLRPEAKLGETPGPG